MVEQKLSGALVLQITTCTDAAVVGASGYTHWVVQRHLEAKPDGFCNPLKSVPVHIAAVHVATGTALTL